MTTGVGAPADALDDELIAVSAIEHYAYCARQCALIHVDQTFDENIYTLRGSQAHERVDIPGSELVTGIRYERALPIWSERLGLIGKADLVEFHGGVPFPVEYKVGRRRAARRGLPRPEDLQVCAQALCLEEMLDVPVPRGALFYWATRRRHELEFTLELRAVVERTAALVHEQIRAHQLPEAPDDARCPACSLKASCLPGVVGRGGGQRAFQNALFRPFGAASADDQEEDDDG